MALTTTIDNSYELQKLFEEYGRGNSFSYEGYQALFDYLDNLSDDIGEDIHLDVIGLCGDFTEYSDYEEIYSNYSYSYNNEKLSWDDINQDDFIEWLNNNTTVIEVTDYKDNITGVIIQNF